MINFIIKTFFSVNSKKRKPLDLISREANNVCISKVISKARPEIRNYSSIKNRQVCLKEIEVKKTVLSKYFMGLEGLSAKVN